MGDKKSPTRPKRQAKPAADEGFWDCSVCTFRNSAEAFKCSICDVRKGTSTRKPRINSQLVAQQVAQQYATPPPPKKEKKEKVEKPDKEKPEKDKDISPSVTKKNTNKKTKPKSDILKDPPSEANSIQSANATTKTSETNHTSRPRLKNVDRSTAQQLAVTVGNVTVIITDFKEKTRSSSTSSSTVTSSAGSEQQNQSSSGSESTDKGSSRSSTPKGDMSAVNDESFWDCTWNCETMNQGMRFKPSTCPCCLHPGESSVDDLVVTLPGEVPLAVGIWLPRNFVPWQLLLTLLCIPLFYMIFLTIIYNWMCSWIYFLYIYIKKICCAQFSMYITTGFVSVLLKRVGRGEGTFIYCVHRLHPVSISS